MPEKERFRLLTSENLATYDTFVLADEQPGNIRTGCVLVVHQVTGGHVTVHKTRLVPVYQVDEFPIDARPMNRCVTCGRVAGVVADRATCPHTGDQPCLLLEQRL